MSETETKYRDPTLSLQRAVETLDQAHQRLGHTAARVTPADLEANIVHVEYVKHVAKSGQVLRVRSDGTQQVNDGCLSVHGGREFGRTTRAARIRVAYQDEDGGARKRKASGQLAHCIQHEIDHLDGILWIDKREDVR